MAAKLVIPAHKRLKWEDSVWGQPGLHSKPLSVLIASQNIVSNFIIKVCETDWKYKNCFY